MSHMYHECITSAIGIEKPKTIKHYKDILDF